MHRHRRRWSLGAYRSARLRGRAARRQPARGHPERRHVDREGSADAKHHCADSIPALPLADIAGRIVVPTLRPRHPRDSLGGGTASIDASQALSRSDPLHGGTRRRVFLERLELLPPRRHQSGTPDRHDGLPRHQHCVPGHAGLGVGRLNLAKAQVISLLRCSDRWGQRPSDRNVWSKNGWVSNIGIEQ